MTVRAVEWKKPYTGWKAIEITEDKVINLKLRDENNLIIWDEWDNEIYVDLQLPDEIRPTDAFPVWVNTGRVIVDNWWDVTWTILVFKTTSGDNVKFLYWDDWKLYIDNGTWSFKQIYLKWEVDLLLSELRTYINWQLALKEDKLTAWANITIQDVVDPQTWETVHMISATWGGWGWSYTAWTGINIDSNNQISNTLPWAVISSTAPSSPVQWNMWYDTTTDKLKSYNWTSWDIVNWINWLTILSYGSSTWNDFIDAYNSNTVVYCKASSNSNPWTGVQWRMAFMAFVNINSSTLLPTSVEFQYYRSVTTHTDAQQWDQVFIYKLESTNWWTRSVTTREAYTKIAAWTGLSSSYSNWTLTLSASGDGSNTKTFYLSNTSDLTTAQAAYDWYAAGKNPIIAYNNSTYCLGQLSTGFLYFFKVDVKNIDYTTSSNIVRPSIRFAFSSDVVSSISIFDSTVAAYLSTTVDYSTPFTPAYNGSPTTKKYVDDRDTYVWTSAPTSNVGEWRLWYDTTNDVLKAHNGTSWDEIWNASVISGDANTTYTIKVSSSAPASWTPNTTITFKTAS